jgi:hypothetical protein
MKQITNLFEYGTFPDFMIIGAQKSGTTTLHNVLNQHPDLVGSKNKELHYFDKTKEERGSLKSYKNNFKKRIFSKKKYFESTPNYMYQKDFGKEIVKFNPKIKLIIVLRDPTFRAFSAWNMFNDFFYNFPEQVEIFKNAVGGKDPIYINLYKNREEFPSFEECIKIEQKCKTSEPSFLRRGLYYQQILEIQKYVNEDNIHILFSEDLKVNMQSELEKITNFLNVSNHKFDIFNSHERKYTKTLDDQTRIELKKFFYEENIKLFELLNQKKSWNDT